MTKEIDLNDVIPYFKALHCDIRWEIIRVLKDGPKSSDDIYNILKQKKLDLNIENNKCEGRCKAGPIENLKKPSLYYHLRELERVGIIQVVKLKPSEHRRAPEKIWKLNLDKLVINFE
ncbi:MAG: hypothetical protein ACFFCM_12130 [Promethearchaeota archaeon]